MKGIIFNLVEEVLCDQHGEDAWDLVVQRAGASGAYTSLGTYPDDELRALLASAADVLATTVQDVTRTVGRHGLARLARRYPDHFVAPDLHAFLLSLNAIVHPEVRKLHPGAKVPDFQCISHGPDSLDLVYRSDRAMCALAEGLTLGAADWYGQRIELTQPLCVHRGDPSCVLRVRAPLDRRIES